MNFDCVGVDSKGEYYMKFHKPFTVVDKIQLLQRSILVCSYAYYELNENVLSDFQYDTNAKQLAELQKQYPDEFKRSRYYLYFSDYCADVDGEHFTSGFDLLSKVEKQDRELYNFIAIDAHMVIDQKRRFEGVGLTV